MKWDSTTVSITNFFSNEGQQQKDQHNVQDHKDLPQIVEVPILHLPFWVRHLPFSGLSMSLSKNLKHPIYPIDLMLHCGRFYKWPMWFWLWSNQLTFFLHFLFFTYSLLSSRFEFNTIQRLTKPSLDFNMIILNSIILSTTVQYFL